VARLVRLVEDPDARRVNLLPETSDPGSWTFAATPTAKASVIGDAGALKVEIATAGEGERDVHLGKGYLEIVPGHTYLLRFRAKADKERPLRAVSLASWPERPTGLNETFALGKDWKEFRVRWDANDPSPDKQNALDFWLGGAGREGAVWIADASLRDVTRRVVRPVKEPRIQALLYDLKSPDKHARQSAGDKLAAVAPLEENRESVALALLSVFNDPDLFVRWSAVKAMGVWATPDTIPALIKKLSDPEHAVRWATLESLGTLHDRRAARPVAEMVVRGQDRHFAANALRPDGRHLGRGRRMDPGQRRRVGSAPGSLQNACRGRRRGVGPRLARRVARQKRYCSNGRRGRPAGHRRLRPALKKSRANRTKPAGG
jgi:hypothetical protein